MILFYNGLRLDVTYSPGTAPILHALPERCDEGEGARLEIGDVAVIAPKEWKSYADGEGYNFVSPMRHWLMEHDYDALLAAAAEEYENE